MLLSKIIKRVAEKLFNLSSRVEKKEEAIKTAYSYVSAQAETTVVYTCNQVKSSYNANKNVVLECKSDIEKFANEKVEDIKNNVEITKAALINFTYEVKENLDYKVESVKENIIDKLEVIKNVSSKVVSGIKEELELRKAKKEAIRQIKNCKNINELKSKEVSDTNTQDEVVNELRNDIIELRNDFESINTVIESLVFEKEENEKEIIKLRKIINFYTNQNVDNDQLLN